MENTKMSNVNADDTRTIEISARVAETIEDRLDRTRYESVDEYAATVLNFVLHELEAGRHSAVDGERSATAQGTARAADVDEDAVEDRLESLGYL